LKSSPTGAFEKYSSVAAATASSSAAVELDGKCWACVHIFTCCSGAVSHLISSYASCWCSLAEGMER
jgi:hypothetical protein